MNELRDLLKRRISTLNAEINKILDTPSVELKDLNDILDNPRSFTDDKVEEIMLSLNGLDIDTSLIDDMGRNLRLLAFINTGEKEHGIKITEHELDNIVKGVKDTRDSIAKSNNTASEQLTSLKKEIATTSEIDSNIKNNEYVDNIDLIMELTRDMPIKNRIELLKELYDYNYNIRINTQEELVDYETDFNYKDMPDKLSIDAVEELLGRYGYDAKLLSEKYIEIIKKRGNTDRIVEVLDTLKEHNLRFNLNDKNSFRPFVSLIIKGDRETMERSFNLAMENGLDVHKLLKHTSVLIRQRKYVSKEAPTGGEGPGPLLEDGAATNFEKNIMLFKNYLFNDDYGWDLPKLFDKCVTVLTTPYQIVERNLMIMKLYEVDMKFKEKNCGAVSCLIEKDFDQKIDRFLEIDKDATYYIKNNLSRLRTPNLVPKLEYIKRVATDYDPYRSRGLMDLPKQLKTEVTDNNYRSNRRDFLNWSSEKLYDELNIIDLSERIPNYHLYEEEVANNVNYKIDVSLLDRPEILALETKYRNPSEPFIYDINGVRISRMKVLRSYQAFVNSSVIAADENALLYSVTRNSLLDEGEFNNIKKALNVRSKVMN